MSTLPVLFEISGISVLTRPSLIIAEGHLRQGVVTIGETLSASLAPDAPRIEVRGIIARSPRVKPYARTLSLTFLPKEFNVAGVSVGDFLHG